MAILAWVLGTAYAVSTRSLRTGTAAGQRSQALGYAQSQIEFIKQALATNDTTNLSRYTEGTPFCVNPNGEPINADDASDPSTADCFNYDNLNYAVKVNYENDKALFTVDVDWEGANLTAEESKLTLYYKIPGGFDLPPQVITGDFSGNLTLNGTVNPFGQDVDECYFLWGTSPTDPNNQSASNKADCSPPFPNPTNTAQSITTVLPSQAPGTYHYRACAVTGGGTTCGLDLVATIVAPPPPPPPPSGGGGACTIESFSVSDYVGGKDETLDIWLSHCYNGCVISGAASGSLAWAGGNTGNNNIYHTTTLSLSSAGGLATIFCSNDGSSDTETFNVIPVSPPPSGNCLGQGNDRTPPTGPDPCIRYLSNVRINANQIEITFRADHCRGAFYGSYGFNPGPRSGNGSDNEKATITVGTGSGTFGMNCEDVGNHYWSRGSTSFTSSSPDPPPPDPPPPPPRIVEDHWHDEWCPVTNDWGARLYQHIDNPPTGNFQSGEDEHRWTSTMMC